MNIRLADRMKDYESGIFQVLNEYRFRRMEQGLPVYNLSVGTPDFKPAEHIMKAVSDAACEPENYKYSLRDIPELIDAVINRYEKRYGVNLKPEQITSVYGSQEGITHIGFPLLGPGDIYLVPDPGYPIFGIGPALTGAIMATYEIHPENDYLPVLEDIPEDIVKKAKVIIVSYPLNPVCKCAPDSFYEELIAWAKKNEIIIIHDNAYSDIVYDGRTCGSILRFPGAEEVAVEFYSLSKSYNYTGARMSFVVGNSVIVDAVKRFRSQIDYGPFLPIQLGAIAALNGPDDMIISQCKEYEKRRDALCEGLRSIGWYIEDSQGTMFAWAKIPEGFEDDTEFVIGLFDACGVLCTPGSSFGKLGRGYVRFALTLPTDTIAEAVKAIDDSGFLKH